MPHPDAQRTPIDHQFLKRCAMNQALVVGYNVHRLPLSEASTDSLSNSIVLGCRSVNKSKLACRSQGAKVASNKLNNVVNFYYRSGTLKGKVLLVTGAFCQKAGDQKRQGTGTEVSGKPNPEGGVQNCRKDLIGKEHGNQGSNLRIVWGLACCFDLVLGKV